MARFDIYPNPIRADRGLFPYVLEIQSDLLYQFAERVCVPLASGNTVPGMTDRFNPHIVVNDMPCRLHPLGITVFLSSELRRPVASAKPQALDIDTALDMMLRGY